MLMTHQCNEIFISSSFTSISVRHRSVNVTFKTCLRIQDVVIAWCKVLPRPVLGGAEENIQKTSIVIVGVMTDVDWATSQLKLEELNCLIQLVGYSTDKIKFIALVWKPRLIVGERSFDFEAHRNPDIGTLFFSSRGLCVSLCWLCNHNTEYSAEN